MQNLRSLCYAGAGKEVNTVNSYITGTTIKTLREASCLTQTELAEKIGVTDKAVSKWETGKGLPDITLVEPLAAALRISVPELMSGNRIVNRNTSGNVRRQRLYVCPICGNVLTAMGEALISCCGIPLPPLEAEVPDEKHKVSIERVEDELYLAMDHAMTKEHYISFLAFATSDRWTFMKLYPEGPAATRMQLCGHGTLYAFCNRHGLFMQKY